MEKIVWDERLKIGVEAVDKAHAKLFRIMDKLLDSTKDANSSIYTYKEGIKYLEAYSMTHFVEEEAYMRSVKYPGYARHKQIHDTFRDKTLVSLRDDLERSGYSSLAMQRFVGILQRWLAEHIMQEDQAIVGRKIAARGSGPTAQISIISKAVDRAVQDAFRVEAKLVSTEYKGQNIGQGYYCRRSYELEDGIRVHLLLGMEELLFLRGANKMLAMRMMHRSELEERVVMQIFGQFLKSLDKLFRAEESAGTCKDSRLTLDEFRAEFMKGYPRSLLFSTKAGYLLFCYRSGRVKDKKDEGAKEEGGDIEERAKTAMV